MTYDLPDEPTGSAVAGKRDEELVFNTRLTEPMLRYFEDRFGAPALDLLIAETDTTLEMLRDPDQWMSTKQLLGLSRAMLEYSNDPLITWRAGLGLLDQRVLGARYHVLRAFGEPGLVYSQMTGFTHLSRITRWKRIEGSRQHVILQFQVERGHSDDILFCLNRQGGLAGVPQVFDLPLARVTQTQCIHEGAPCCEYRVEWLPPPLGQGLAPWLAGGAIVTTAALTAGFGLASPVSLFSSFVAVALLAANVGILRRQIRAAATEQRDQLTAARVLLDENLQRNRERLLLEKVDLATRKETDVAGLVQTTLHAIRNTLGYDRAIFLRVNAEADRLVFAGGAGLDDETLRLLSNVSIMLNAAKEDEFLFANILRSEGGILVEDVAEYKKHVNPRNQMLLDRLGSTAFVAVPLRGPDGPLGLLVVDQLHADAAVGPRDLQMLQQVGNLVGLALASATLVDSLRRERAVLQTALLLNQKISQYLPRAVVDKISDDPSAALELGGERRRAAILFSDIVGFTPWAERVEPETAVNFLNWYFTAMDAIVDASHGILDKRIGDGMMVVFLEGEGLEEPARRALKCGLAMQAQVRALNAMDRRPREDAFEIRIGVSHGEPVAGNLGSAQRMEYTVIGDTVNVASRIEGKCAPGAVLATEQAVYAAGPGVRAEPRGELIVKGRTQAVSAWEVIAVE